MQNNKRNNRTYIEYTETRNNQKRLVLVSGIG